MNLRFRTAMPHRAHSRGSILAKLRQCLRMDAVILSAAISD